MKRKKKFIRLTALHDGRRITTTPSSRSRGVPEKGQGLQQNVDSVQLARHLVIREPKPIEDQHLIRGDVSP